MGKRYEIRSIGGVDHKECRGPLHRAGKWLPTHEFQFRSVGLVSGELRLRGTCRACEHVYRYHYPESVPLAVGYTLLSPHFWMIKELEARLGRMEAIRRTGIGKTTWMKWIKARGQLKIQRGKLARVILTLQEVRAEGIVRHKRSIKRGASRRGEKELVPRIRNDFRSYDYGDRGTPHVNGNGRPVVEQGAAVSDDGESDHGRGGV